MTDESAELQLRRLLNKAIDDAWLAGIEKGKMEGRRAGMEQVLTLIQARVDEIDENMGALGFGMYEAVQRDGYVEEQNGLRMLAIDIREKIGEMK